MKIIFALLLALLLMTSCAKRPVKARLEAITPGYRASSRVGTPDPLKACFCGQQVVVSWKVSKTCKNLKLTLSYITGALKLEKVDLPIDNYRGAISYRLINQDFICRKGILTYKVELFSNGSLIACYKPRSWVEWVDISE
jgi:hypothetical protein